MKRVLVLFAILRLYNAKCFSDVYDDFDAARYRDHKYLCSVISCFLGHTCCDPENAFFKTNAHEIWETRCARCSRALKHITKVFVEELQEGAKQCPYRAKEFLAVYDPNGDLKERLLSALKYS